MCYNLAELGCCLAATVATFWSLVNQTMCRGVAQTSPNYVTKSKRKKAMTQTGSVLVNQPPLCSVHKSICYLLLWKKFFLCYDASLNWAESEQIVLQFSPQCMSMKRDRSISAPFENVFEIIIQLLTSISTQRASLAGGVSVLICSSAATA